MVRASSIAEIGRWMLAAAAVFAALYGTPYLGIFFLFGPFPKDLAAPTFGFLTGSVPVLAGSLLAPRHRLVTAVVLCVLTVSLAFSLSLVPGAVAGCLVAVGFVAWWFYPRRTVRSTRWVGRAACATFLAFIGLVYARHADVPACSDPLPSELTHALGTSASRVTSFYRYDLGGFFDHEWLWRIDAEPDVMALVVSGLGLQSTHAVSERFWKMPPQYWPRSMPAGAEAFQSAAFSADGRGPDGPHYFLLHDKTRERGFVWFKHNF